MPPAKTPHKENISKKEDAVQVSPSAPEQPESVSPPKSVQSEVSSTIPSVDINAPIKFEETNPVLEEEHQNKSGRRLFIAGSFIVFLIIAASVIFFFFLNKGSQSEQIVTPTEVPRKEEKIAFDRSKWSFEVLNGSGVSGAAKLAADKLTALGYLVVKVGNADSSDYTGTQIFIAASFYDESQDLVRDLSGEFESATIVGTLQDSTSSARVIIGK